MKFLNNSLLISLFNKPLQICFTWKNYSPLPPPLLSCSSMPSAGDKRNCANEPLKSLNGCRGAHNGTKNAALDKGWPLPRHSALQWWIRTDAWTWAGFGAAEAPSRPPLGRAKGTGRGDTLGPPWSRASKQSGAANYPRHPQALIDMGNARWPRHTVPTITLYHTQSLKLFRRSKAAPSVGGGQP